MRLFIAILLVVIATPSVSFAQVVNEDGRTIYNRTGNSTSAPQYYNTPSSGYSNTRGPLSLKQMLQGKTNAANGSQGAYYGGSNFRPYGADSNNYSLSLSPQEIDASRSRRDAAAQMREQESLKAIELANQDIDSQTQNYLNSFQSTQPGVVQPVAPSSRFKKRESGFEIPKKVFNSVR